MPIRLCLNWHQYGSLGSYYYLKYLKPIAIKPRSEMPGAWAEQPDGPNQPLWQIEMAGSDQMKGSWTLGKRQMPVRLDRVPGDFEELEQPCGSMLHNRPRLTGIKVKTERSHLDGVAYTREMLVPGSQFNESVEIETFRIDGRSPASQRINSALHKPLKGYAAGGPWFDCLISATNLTGLDGEFAEIVKPTMIGKRWLAVDQQVGGFCGGAHSYSGNSSRVFDLQTGAEIDLHDWLTDWVVERSGDGAGGETATLRPNIRKAILAKWRAEDEDCQQIVEETVFWDIGLSRSGFIFTPSLPHAAQACTESFPMNFSQLRPFLNAEGKLGIAALVP